MQPPAEELFLLGRTIPAVGVATNLATVSGTYATADLYRQAIDYKYLAGAQNLAQGYGDEGEPISEIIQTAIEARTGRQ